MRRHEVTLMLPASRKVRALLAYLALARHPIARNHLCELLWDVPNDPRGELRWSLSKIRGFVDEPDRRRISAQGDTVKFDLTDCFVDATEVAAATQAIEALPYVRLKALAALFAGDFLDGLELDGCPAFAAWLAAQRRRFRGRHAAVLERLVATAPDDEGVGYLERWIELAPFDARAHELLLGALVRHDRVREAQEHVAATVRLFEDEGLDVTSIRDAWRRARTQRNSSAAVPAAAAGLLPAAGGADEDLLTVARRASVAVMPFVDSSTVTSARGGTADALAHDVITRLAKLRSLFVIAQGTVFALHERGIGPDEAARMLDVDYVASGSVQRRDTSLTVTIELVETRTARIVWAEVFSRKLDDAFEVLDEIGNSIVASIASEIEASERNRAVLMPPNSLDAWEAHHRGLWHMYRFNKPDNDRAQHFFEMAVHRDPTFARAYAGLSFTHWQNAFQGWAERGPETDRALEAAGQSIMADERDPAAHWAVGRALWLQGQFDRSVVELEQAIDLSPNFALGHYTLAFVHCQSGDPHAAISFGDRSRDLSPCDPLLFGMLATRALALMRLGRFAEAADFGVKAASRPNAHAHILAVTAFSLALDGRLDEGRAYVASIRKTRPHYGLDDYLRAYQFTPQDEKVFRGVAQRLSMR
jgi:DNA-binding SARP family transcriptional activator/TolB-like protein